MLGSLDVSVKSEDGVTRMMVPVERSRRARPSSPVLTEPFTCNFVPMEAVEKSLAPGCFTMTVPVISFMIAVRADADVGCEVVELGWQAVSNRTPLALET